MQVSNWHGIVGPAGMSPELLAQVHGAIRKAIQMPEIKAKLDSEGAAAVASTPAKFGEFLEKESAVWGGLVKELGIKWA
jgi:tripartite-type tricarboxylate transporter receptor subunit TctC